MPASGPRSRGARAHPPPHQGCLALARPSADSRLVLATQNLGGITGRGTSQLGRAARAAVLAAPVYLLAAAVPPGGLFRERRFRDVGLYGDYAQAFLDGRVPYRDFAVEYPPGGFLVFLPPALLPDGWYLHAFKALMAALGVATLFVAALVLARLGASRARLYAAVFAIALS